MNKFPHKYKLFCEHYISLKGKRKEAAISAGYSKKTAGEQASRLLRNVKVLEYIKKLQDKLSEKLEITSELITKEIHANAKLARKDKQYSASNQAFIALGKQIGMWKESSKINLNYDISSLPEEYLTRIINAKDDEEINGIISEYESFKTKS